MIFDRGAESASQALSKWLGHEVRLATSEIELVELEQAAGLLGPADALVAAGTMGFAGRLTGLILLVFEDRSGLALVDLLTRQPIGTTTSWGELEQSAAKETTNIVGCAYLNALAAHLPGSVPSAAAAADTTPGRTGGDELVPTPPTFVREFAGSLLEFAVMEQVLELDQVLLVHTQFEAAAEGLNLDWTLLIVPSRASLDELAAALAQLQERGFKLY
jgi:chemotaxis protein CheC